MLVTVFQRHPVREGDDRGWPLASPDFVSIHLSTIVKRLDETDRRKPGPNQRPVQLRAIPIAAMEVTRHFRGSSFLTKASSGSARPY